MDWTSTLDQTKISQFILIELPLHFIDICDPIPNPNPNPNSCDSYTLTYKLAPPEGHLVKYANIADTWIGKTFL